ncbi:MFS transporter [Arthrobacter dokdonensis]|uniref:MFS transporter n=1 Tax=Arthrobacter dokdonellae TaxID=2211210 RepID=UPI001D131D5E|nr:MFS transporter [Arthrobacter dokdonellae]
MIFALSFAGVVVALMQTLVIPLIPQLPRLLHTTASNASWVVTATLLAGAVVTPISGRLGDMFGKRRMLILSMTALIVGSVLCAVTEEFRLVVAGRALQGIATGAIPLGISILRDELPPKRVAFGMAVVSATLGVGGAIGLPVSAAIAQAGNWHVLFWAAAGMGVLALGLVLGVVRESPVRLGPSVRFDYLGAAGLGLGLVALLVGVSKGATWGWASPLTWGSLGISLMVLLLWGIYELRTAAPLVDLRVSARRQVLFTNLASVVVGFAMYGMSLTLPQLLMTPKSTGYGFGLDMVQAGLVLAPGGLVMLLLSPISAGISARRGPKFTLMAGAAVIAVGYGFALLANTQIWQVMVAGMIISGGIGLAYASMPALIMASVPVHETASANGLNTLMRSVGTTVSAAVMALVLTAMTVTVGSTKIPSQDGFVMTFVIGAVAALTAVAVVAFIPRRPAGM